jgi:hypothetical protein
MPSLGAPIVTFGSEKRYSARFSAPIITLQKLRARPRGVKRNVATQRLKTAKIVRRRFLLIRQNRKIVAK